MTKVYAWMSAGIALTAFISYVVASNGALAELIIGNKILFYALLFGQIIEVLVFATLLKKLSPGGALLLYLVYAATVGLTTSIIFFAYTAESIGAVFGITAALFAALSVFGYITKIDLGRVGTFCFMALIGLIIAQLVNIFIVKSDLGFTILSGIAVLIFSGLTAYDTQKIKETNVLGDEGSDEDQKQAINGALELYLDFINLFLNLLRLFGSRR